MKFIRQRLAIILVIVFIVIFGEMALGNAIAKSQALIQPSIEITEEFKNIPHNHDPSISENQKAINDFAWKVFIALNWPVDCKRQPLYYTTEPLSPKNQYEKIIGQAPEAPRLWELYPSAKDVFLPNGATPPSLDELPEVKECLSNHTGSEIEYQQNLRLTKAGELVTEAEFSEYKTASRKDLLDGYGELIPKISLEDIDAANQIPLVDRQGNYVINEIRLNPVEFQQIIENKWFDAAKLLMFNNPNTEKLFKLVCSEPEKDHSSPYCNQYEAEGAIEIKAAWRVFDERNTQQEKARYYTNKRKIVTKEGEILDEEAELGLIGFHIMHKTSSQGWIWSTFEHIDNAPPGDAQKNTRYTLYNNEYNTENGQKNVPYVTPPYLWYISKDRPKAVTLKVNQGIAIKDQVPSQICRANPISNLTKKQNKEWQKSLKAIAESSVWQYYQLIGTEWLLHPEIPYSNKEVCRREITPNSPPLTNVSLEPYAQGVSCIVCHTSARLSIQGNFCQLNEDPRNCADFSFLMDNAKSSEQIPVEQLNLFSN